ncbi:RNA polymerase sigma factor [Cerasicoccus maritimus]|uniref:RNA polymerase sigma factor n=1 Tax=Cerasicoccus maritimus TaxID=490089 RepID=UPI00285275CA|nr:sigma-70 family RNA polymerase sigma factor [Cerasicoccus maritimus]
MGDDSLSAASRPQLSRAIQVYSKPLSRYAYSLCGCVHRSQDAVQDTFLRLAERDEPIKPEERLGPWLFKVCRSRVIDQFRKEGRMTPGAELPETNPQLPPVDTPRESAERGDSAAAVWEQMGNLSPNQREVLRLKFQAQLSYREIADVLDLSVSNVGYLVHTAMASLRQRLRTESDLLG